MFFEFLNIFVLILIKNLLQLLVLGNLPK